MKPDWDELGEKFESSKKVLIGDVDCTAKENEKLCEAQGVTGYPTLKYYTPGDHDGQVYEGDRDLASLTKFAKSLGPSCSPAHKTKCSPEELAQLEAFMTMPAAELEAKIATVSFEISAAEAQHKALLDELQAKFKTSEEGLKELKAQRAPDLKLMKAALTKPEATQHVLT